MNERLFGTARWAETGDLAAAHLAVQATPMPNALILGKVVNWQSSRGPHPFERCWQLGSPVGDDGSSAYLQTQGEGHVITIAPTRSGKGVGLIIPNLLNWNGPVVTFDPKGENYTLTSPYRRTALGQRIWCFDPYHETAAPRNSRFATLARIKRLYNCLGTINEAMAGDLMAEAARIAEAIVIRPKDEKDPFFNTAAQAMIKAAIILTCYRFENYQCPPISRIRDLLLNTGEMARLKTEIEDKLNQSHGREMTKYNLLLKSMDEYEAYADNRDVRATVAMQTEFLEDRGVADMLDADNFGRASDIIFDPQERLRQNDNSVYIVIPPRHLARQVRTVRLILSAMLDETMRRSPAPPGGNSRILFLLDEVGQFGTLDPLRKAVTLGAAYGTILWMFWQDIVQLKNIYREDWESFMSNSCVQQFFGCNDMRTAEMVSKRCGLKFAPSMMLNDGIASRGIFSDVNHQLTQYGMPIELIRQYEVVRACPEIVFTFKQGTFPILVRRISYYSDRVFRQRYQNAARMT